MSAPKPLAQADLSRVDAVFTDVDGTLTTHDRLTSDVLRAIERLAVKGVKVVLVSGRPAGWGECWARQLPVAGVIVENGALAFVPKGRRLQRLYSQPAAVRRTHRAKLTRLVAAAIASEPGARLSSDSAYTEVDLAIDYAEEASLGVAAAKRLESFLRKRGANAVRSSVHVNTWFGRFDKRSAVERFAKQVWRKPLQQGQRRAVYLGDSLNDAPMFAAFTLSVGVANVLDVWADLAARPNYVTTAREGQGFIELADAIPGKRTAAVLRHSSAMKVSRP